MSSKHKTLSKTILFLVLPLLSYVWTSTPALAASSIYFVVFFGLAAIGMSITKKFSRHPWMPATVYTLLVLFLVGSTGWFLSPFFFLLYLWPFYLGFIYSPIVAFGFLASLLIVFISSVGEVDMGFDMMTLLSLLLVVPLILYLRRKYLVLRQTNKDILILQEESGIHDADTIARLLSNRVTRLGVNMRQPLTFIKQCAGMLLEDDLTPQEATVQLKRIRTTAAESLEQIRDFEGETSVNEVLTNKKEVRIPKNN